MTPRALRDGSWIQTAWPVRAVVILAVMSVAACTPRFQADFEEDDLFMPPALHPPGPPDDRIVINTTPVRGDGIVIQVTDEPDLVAPGQPFRFMSLIHHPNPGLSSSVLMVAEPMATARQPIYAHWEQVLKGSGSGSILLAAWSGRGNPLDGLCVVWTGNDEMSIECGSEHDFIRGIDTHRVHTVLLRIDRWPQRRAVLWVVQGDTESNVAILTSDDVPAPVEGQEFRAQIEHFGQADSAYRFNSFNIQERDPG